MDSLITFRTPGVTPIADRDDLKDKILVIHHKHLSGAHQHPKFQLWKAVGGFGCTGGLRSTSILAECLDDKDISWWGREDFIGVASDSLIDEVYKPSQPTS